MNLFYNNSRQINFIMKLCQIYNGAALYRTDIYKKIDETFDSDYIIGALGNGIKQMDTSILRGHVASVENKKIIGNWYYQSNVISVLGKDYDAYLMTGETRCLSTWLFCILRLLFYPKKRVYFWTHGWYGKETFVEKIVKKIFLHLANGGIFLYGNYAKGLMINEGFNPNKLFVIHNSLAYDTQLKLRNEMKTTSVYREHFGNDNPVIVFIGRLTKEKKLDLLLNAIERAKNTGQEYNLVLIGTGVDESNLKKIVSDCDLDLNVWFYGACYDEKKNAELIYNADLCVAPGNVGLTAMHVLMFGTPVITHGNFPYQMPEFEAVHSGVTGDFFEHNNLDSLSTCIDNWFKANKGCRDKVRQACYKEIDTQWTPYFQIEVLKKNLK